MNGARIKKALEIVFDQYIEHATPSNIVMNCDKHGWTAQGLKMGKMESPKSE